MLSEYGGINKAFMNDDRRMRGDKLPKGPIPARCSVCGAHFVVASSDVKGKPKFKSELLSCGLEKQARLSTREDFLEQSDKVLDLLCKIGMRNAKSLVLGRAIKGGPRDVLGDPSFMKSRNQRRG